MNLFVNILYIKMKEKQNSTRQIKEYYELMQDFDNIIGQFSKILTLKSQYYSINKTEIQQQWEEYLQHLARDKNMLKQTMNLFKLEFVKEQNQESCYIDIELANCMKDMQERESRIDAKIREKRQELQEQRKRQIKNQQSLKRNKFTEEEIRREQEEYNKFVAQYMADIEKKRAVEAQSRLKKQLTVPAFDPKLKLQMPKLNDQQRKLIGYSSLEEIINYKSNVLNQNIELSCNDSYQNNQIQAQLNAMLSQIEFQVSPLQKSLQSLIEKVDRIEQNALTQIKSNEQKIKAEMEVNLQQVVKTSCRSMLSKLSQQIKSQLELSIKKIYDFQEQSVKQYQKSIAKFKEFAKLQVKHRINLFHENRRKLEQTAQQIAKKQRYKQRASK